MYTSHVFIMWITTFCNFYIVDRNCVLDCYTGNQSLIAKGDDELIRGDDPWWDVPKDSGVFLFYFFYYPC